MGIFIRACTHYTILICILQAGMFKKFRNHNRNYRIYETITISEISIILFIYPYLYPDPIFHINNKTKMLTTSGQVKRPRRWPTLIVHYTILFEEIMVWWMSIIYIYIYNNICTYVFVFLNVFLYVCPGGILYLMLNKLPDELEAWNFKHGLGLEDNTILESQISGFSLLKCWSVQSNISSL